jgi:hypothetical protein
MGLDMSMLVKLPQMDMFARPITVTPAGAGVAYDSRGIWHKNDDDFFAEDGSVVTDHKTSIDVLDAEFAVVPRQGDLVTIPADGSVPAEGTFTILSAHSDGGGMTNLVLEEHVTTVSPAPPAPPKQRGRL